jgi:hypothetical protein
MSIVLTARVWSLALPANSLPKLPDLTQTNQLIAIANNFGLGLLVLALLAIGLGMALALINFGLKPKQASAVAVLDRWTIRYTELLQLLQTTALIAILSVGLFLCCGTLANRYQVWEQSKFGTPVATSARIEQAAPQIEYTATEPYSYNTQLDGKVVKVQDSKAVKKIMLPSASNLRLKMMATENKNVAEIDFAGDYQIRNTSSATDNSTLILQMRPPQGLGVVKNFTVQKDGQRVLPQQGNDYNFPLTIAPGATSQIQVNYRGQGAPSWLYRTQGQLLSKLQLAVETDLKNVDSIGGLMPTQVENKGSNKLLTWVFGDNAAVDRPFGAGATVMVDRQSGILPGLLSIAPALWLWWLALLLMAMPLGLRDITASAGVFLALTSALTYGSRLIRTDWVLPYLTPQTLWLGMTASIAILGISLARRRQVAANVALAALVGLVLPVFGLLGQYRGPIIGMAALMSIGWLATPRWYGRPRRIRVAQEVPQDLLLLDGADNRPVAQEAVESMQSEQAKPKVTSPTTSPEA